MDPDTYTVSYHHLVPVDIFWVVAVLALILAAAVFGVVWLKRSRKP